MFSGAVKASGDAASGSGGLQGFKKCELTVPLLFRVSLTRARCSIHASFYATQRLTFLRPRDTNPLSCAVAASADGNGSGAANGAGLGMFGKAAGSSTSSIFTVKPGRYLVFFSPTLAWWSCALRRSLHLLALAMM
jgi:hypothetical protein